jgi:hypothetical protein
LPFVAKEETLVVYKEARALGALDGMVFYCVSLAENCIMQKKRQ